MDISKYEFLKKCYKEYNTLVFHDGVLLLQDKDTLSRKFQGVSYDMLRYLINNFFLDLKSSNFSEIESILDAIGNTDYIDELLKIEVISKIERFSVDESTSLIDKLVSFYETQGCHFEGDFRVAFLIEEVLTHSRADYGKKSAADMRYSFILKRLFQIQGTDEWYNLNYACFRTLNDYMPFCKEAFEVTKLGTLLPDEYLANDVFGGFIRRIYINHLGWVDENLNWIGDNTEQ